MYIWMAHCMNNDAPELAWAAPFRTREGAQVACQEEIDGMYTGSGFDVPQLEWHEEEGRWYADVDEIRFRVETIELGA